MSSGEAPRPGSGRAAAVAVALVIVLAGAFAWREVLGWSLLGWDSYPMIYAARITDAASFLGDDEKREAVGYPPRGGLAAKAGFRPDQPRVPKGNPDGGQWTDEGSGARVIPVQARPPGNQQQPHACGRAACTGTRSEMETASECVRDGGG